MIKFRTELPAFSFPHKIEHGERIMLVGSCFTEHMGNYLADGGFEILQNPHGILFNPVSVEKAIDDYLQNTIYTEADLTPHAGLYHSWHHHSRFSFPKADESVSEINNTIGQASSFLGTSQWLMLTFGSAFVYHLVENDLAVANCHKFDAKIFKKKLLSPSQCEEVIGRIITKVQARFPSIKIVLTVSPVRHAREGLVENNRSKAALIHGVHSNADKFENVFYFPSYELVIDDLRDYRFFMEDLIHPNRQATEYVWGRFKESLFSTDTEKLVNKINKLKISARHKSFNPNTPEHQAFLKKLSDEIKLVQKQYPKVYLDRELLSKIIE